MGYLDKLAPEQENLIHRIIISKLQFFFKNGEHIQRTLRMNPRPIENHKLPPFLRQ